MTEFFNERTKEVKVVDKTDTVAGDSAEADRRERRRQKLGALRNKRSDDTGGAVAALARAEGTVGAAGKAAGKAGRGAGKAAGGRRGGGGKLAALAGGDNGDGKRKAIARVMRVLTDTPADAGGMVPDTPFTQAGVKRLMDMLRERAADAGAAGARVAGGLLKFLSSKEGEEAIHGASLEKLKRAGQMASRRGGGRGRRGRQ